MEPPPVDVLESPIPIVDAALSSVQAPGQRQNKAAIGSSRASLTERRDAANHIPILS